MKRIYLSSLLLLFILALVSCARDFTTPVFNSKTVGHRMVAILPFQMVYTGKQDPKLGPDDIRKINEAEAQAFQRALHNQLLRQSGSKKKHIKIEFQTPERTNRILADSGIVPMDAWKETPERLAQILGVQSIIFTKVEKEKFLTDLESYGLTIAGEILEKIPLPEGLEIPMGADPQRYNRTYRIKMDCQLLNGVDGSLLWKLPMDTDIDWNSRANEVIEQATWYCARRFPYRNRNYYR